VNKDRLYLESIRDCMERIAEYTAGGEQAFLASRLIQDGEIRKLEVIGEATKNLSSELRDANSGAHPSLPQGQSHQGLAHRGAGFAAPPSSVVPTSWPMRRTIPC